VSAADSVGRGLRSILAATAVAGVFGYAIQLLAPRMLESDYSYVGFSVFWSTLYLGVSAMSGVQQEVARATHPALDEPPSAVLRTFTLWAAAAVAVASVVVAVLVHSAVLPGESAGLAAVLTVGLIGYLANAVLSGVLYGLRLWAPVAALIIVDVVIRAVLVIAGFALQLSTGWLALLIAVPFGASFALVWLWVRWRVIGAFRLDVGFSRLVAHVAGTVGASAASGVMITGLPMLIGVTAAGAPAATIGSLILAISLTRAPIVIPVIALQSFLITAVFRGGRVRTARLLGLLGAALAIVGVLAGIGWLVGPALISWVSAGRFAVDGGMAAAIVASAGLIAAMCVTGPALIAARQHAENLVAWVAAGGLTVLALVLPLGVETRVANALLVPPVAGLLIHVVFLLRGSTLAARRNASPGR